MCDGKTLKPNGVYIAGPMRGYKEFNFPAFFKAEEKLKELGRPIYNPARIDKELDGVDVAGTNGTYEEMELRVDDPARHFIRRDCIILCDHCNAIYLLKGWENSDGAKVEAALAKMLKFEFFYEEGAERNV